MKAWNNGIGGHLRPWLRIPLYARILQPFGAFSYDVARMLRPGIAVGLAAAPGLSFAIEPGWLGRYPAVLRAVALMFWRWRIASYATAVTGAEPLIFSSGVVLRHSVAIRDAEAAS